MPIKKILCKYFSDKYEHKVVTIRSFVLLLLLYLICAISIILSPYTIYAIIYNLPPTFFIMMGTPGVMIVSIILVGDCLYVIDKLSKIEITRCERKD